MKLEVKQENIATFKSYLETLGKLEAEMIMTFETEKLTMRVDHTGCVVGRVILNKDFFSTFEGEGSYYIFLVDVVSYLKKVKDKLILTDDNGVLNIHTDKANFKTPLMVEEKEYMDIPELTFEGKAVITSDVFSEMLSTFSTIKPDVIKLSYEDNKFIATTQKNQREVDMEIITVSLDNISEYAFLDFNFVNKFNLKTNDNITISIKKDAPMLLTTETPISKLEFIIAPRVGDNF